VVPDRFRFEKCAIYRYMKTRVEITIHPFRLQGLGGFIYTKVITSIEIACERMR